MPNTILTPSIIAKTALSLLRSNMVMGSLVYRDYSTEFRKVGQSITIRKPPSFTVQNLTTEAAGAGITTQNATETSVTLTLDQWKGVRFAVTSKERAYSLEELATRIIKPAILPLANDIDSYLLGLYTSIPYYYGTAGTTPDSLDDLAGVGRVLADNKCPTDDLALVVNPTAQAKLWPVMAAMQAPRPAAGNPALERAQLGMINNMNTFMDQNVVSHNAGGDLAAVVDNKGTAYAAGATTIHLDDLSASLVAGDVLIFGTAPNAEYHSVASVTTIGSNEQDVVLNEPIVTASLFVDDAAVVILADHVANLAFHRNGIALATAPMEAPLGGARGETVTDSEFGITCRAVYDWDNQVMSDVITLDILYGAKVIYPELCARLIG